MKNSNSKRTVSFIMTFIMVMISAINMPVMAASKDSKVILKEQVTELEKSIDELQAELDDAMNTLKEVEAEVESEDTKSNKKLDKTIKNLNTTLKSTNKSVDSFMKKLDPIEDRIEKIKNVLPNKPEEDVQKPEEDVQKPEEEVQKPNEEVQKPNEDVQKPNENENVQKPNEDVQIPANIGAQKPSGDKFANVPKEQIYNMAERYDKTKTDKENLQAAIDSGCPYIFLNKDLALPKGAADSEYIWINRPVYIYSNLENKLDIAIRITADDVTLDSLYVTREIRPNRAFNNLTIKNCIVDGSDGMGIHLLNYTEGMVCKNITIENCTLRNNAWHGIAFKGNIPSKNKPANGGNGVGYGEYENVVIKNCLAYNNGYVVQPDGSIKSTHEYSAGINVVDSCYSMKNCVVENCVSYGNYSNGFHMESVPVKENVKLVNCKAYDNGKNNNGTHFGCGFSVVDEGVVLQNCVSENNTVANYTVLKNQAHSPMKKFNGTLINCYDNGMLINWNDEIANSTYNGDNLVYNGDLKFGSMHYGFYYSTYPCWFYKAPNFLRRNGYKTPYYEAGVHTDSNNKNFIHGKFMTNIFELQGDKKYKLTVVVDNSKNVDKDKLTMGLFRYDYVSDKDTKANKRDKSFEHEFLNTADCKSGLTTYTFELDATTMQNFADGHYVLYAKNTAIDKKMSLENINPDDLNIKIYSIRLEEMK